MKFFYSLSHRGQLGRLRRLGENALAAYDIGTYKLTPLGYVLKCTFRVDTSQGRYLLRISHPQAAAAAHVRSEAMLLAALDNGTALRVPRPVPTRDGALVQEVTEPGVVPEARVCTLFYWVDGRVLSKRPQAPVFERVGHALGQLHAYGAEYEGKGAFAGPRYTWDGALEALWQQLPAANPALTEYQWDILSQTMERGRQVMAGMGKDGFGLVHGNFYWGNYLFDGDRIGIIEFDECGQGYYLYHVAEALMELPDGPADGSLTAAFLAGYRRAQPLTASQEGAIEDFMAIRTMAWLMAWLMHADHPIVSQRIADYITAALSRLRGYLET